MIEEVFLNDFSLAALYNGIVCFIKEPKLKKNRIKPGQDKKIYYNAEIALRKCTEEHFKLAARDCLSVSDLVYINLVRYYKLAAREMKEEKNLLNSKFEQELILPNLQKEIRVALTFLLDFYRYEVEEIAKILDISTRSVRNYLNRTEGVLLNIFKRTTEIVNQKINSIIKKQRGFIILKRYRKTKQFYKINAKTLVCKDIKSNQELNRYFDYV